MSFHFLGVSPFHLLVQPFKDREMIWLCGSLSSNVLYKEDDVKSETFRLCKYLLMPPTTEDAEKAASDDWLL